MTVTISLPPETEQKLRAEAAATGKDVPTIVREALEEKLAAAGGARLPAGLPYEQWVIQFNNWVASHKPVGHPVDDSRESIYSGRGE